MQSTKNITTLFFVIIFSLWITAGSFAQHRGDDLSFQGLAEKNDLGVKAAAMGGAYTSIISEPSALFYNPAGLSGLSQIKVSVTGNYSTWSWRENQVYRPNRYFVTLPFYLEGLYVPDPADNGKWDHERPWTDDQQIDSSYVVEFPELGQEPYSEEAADWNVSKNNFAFNNLLAAVPLNLGEQKFVIAASYNRQYNVEDFDRNDSYLDPHIGYTGYGEIARVDGNDTLVMNWSAYKRQRSGTINSITGGVSYDLSELIKLGVGVNVMWGSTDDYQSLERIGTFDLIRENRFRFSYTTDNKIISGTSDFSAASFNLGALVDLEKFDFGVRVTLPYTLERKWSYTELLEDSIFSSTNSLSGTDELEIPAGFNVGVSFSPTDNFKLALDYGYNPYSKSEITSAMDDPYIYKWADRQQLSLGVSYSPFEILTLMGGYKNSSEVFIPDGAAVKDTGPKYDIFSAGISLKFFFGEFNIAYLTKTMKYYDSYYSNSNYNTETYSNLMFGYVFGF